jgi:signal transduction histidine kinase
MNRDLKVKILLVEDDEDDYFIIKDYLSDTFLNYEIRWAQSFENFQSLLSQEQFDIVITDYMLGSTSGLEVLKLVKQQNSHTPVVILTGKGDESIDREAMRLGASDYLVKGSFGTPLIERSIRYALERAKNSKMLLDNESYKNSLNKIVSTDRIARMIAHEVRTPLTNIVLCVDQLKANLKDEEARTYIEIIDRNNQRINQLVNDLLDSTRFGDIRLEKHKLSDVIHETLQAAADRMKIKSIRLNQSFSDPGIELKLDKEKIKLALLNIIINAIEATEAVKDEGTIDIRVMKDMLYVRVHISDNGSGMSQETQSKLFEPFFTMKPKGSGLGLTSAQNIILGHKGKIEVKSELNKGTEFIISFPVHSEEALPEG